MSGGRFNYTNDSLCDDVTGCYPDYGLSDIDVQHRSRYARKLNVLEDAQISELVYDVFCLLHSYDWYRSGDTGEETYLDDIAYFKKKWFKKPNISDIKKEIDEEIEGARESLYKQYRYLLDEKKEEK